MPNFKWEILRNFQTMYSIFNGRSTHLPNVIFQEKVKMTIQTSFVKSYKVVICIYRFFRWFFFRIAFFSRFGKWGTESTAFVLIKLSKWAKRTWLFRLLRALKLWVHISGQKRVNWRHFSSESQKRNFFQWNQN